MGSNIAAPITAVEDIYILGNEEEKCQQEIQAYEEEMDNLLLEMVEVEINYKNILNEENFDNEENRQKLAEKFASIISMQTTKANSFAILCNKKIASLEKQVQILKMQKDQSVLLANIYKDYQERMDVSSSVQQDEEFSSMDDIEVASLNTILLLGGSNVGRDQKKKRKELKAVLFDTQDEVEEEEKDETEKNPSELMKLEEAALEKLKEKLMQKNQTPTQAFLNKIKIAFKKT